MIFSVQRFVEDRLRRLGLEGDGQYAVALANIYTAYRHNETDDQILRRTRRISTVAYRNNPNRMRSSVERQLLDALDAKVSAQGGLPDLFRDTRARVERRRLRKAKRRSIKLILQAFQRTVQGRTIDAFWKSRIAGTLNPRPETIAQTLLTQFIMGGLSRRSGHLFREVASGVGFVDIAVMFGATTHLLELKVQTGQFTGPAQLESYMVNENRKTGWLVVFDARSTNVRSDIPKRLKRNDRTISVVVIDINPIAPSRKL